MTKHSKKHIRVLAVTPSNRGFGFAIMEGKERLVHWGIKTVKDDKNAESLAKIKKLFTQYAPEFVVMEDCGAKGSRRSPRIRKLNRAIACLAAKQKVKVKSFSRKQVMESFFIDGGTKHALAKLLSVRFSEELGTLLPPKRRAWMSEDYNMGIFDAVALALNHFTS